MVILVLCMLAVCVGLIMGVLYNYFDKQFYRELQNEASYISEGVELKGMDYLENISSGSSRITWIDKDGTVLFDNKVDASSLDNHGEREEVQQAEKYGAGSSTRYSSTRNEKTINYALRLDDDTVLRVSADSDTMLRILTGMIQPIIAVIAIALIVAGILAYRLSKRIVRPLNDIDLEHPEQANTYEELSPFLRKIEVQNKQINRQIKELRRQQMEFSAPLLRSRLADCNTFIWYLWNDADASKGNIEKFNVIESINTLTQPKGKN